MAEIVEWESDPGRVELRDGGHAVVQFGDELLVEIDEGSGAMVFIEHYPKVVH